MEKYEQNFSLGGSDLASGRDSEKKMLAEFFSLGGSDLASGRDLEKKFWRMEAKQ